MSFHPDLLTSTPFVPHTPQHLAEARVFPSPLPDAVHAQLFKEYEELNDIDVSHITYQSDGLKVTGVSVLPKTLGTNHPILIYNRGGSREYGKLTLYTIMRTLVPFARRGYLVFASNYRGNDGGEGVEEFGGRDVDDVLNLLAIARAHPAFDGSNVFMIGHSRGGMMTTLAIKRGAQLNAAVSIAGIADVREMAGNIQMHERVLAQLVPGYLKDPQGTLELRSSLCWPEAITVPLLLLHGDNDKDVPISHSLTLQDALERVHAISELVIYPGGSHALVRHWNEVLAKCFEWLEHNKLQF